MDIAVILHQVPDTEAKIDPDGSQGGRIKEDNIKFILNPYDEYAIEEALRITEKSGGEVIGIAIGPEREEAAIRSAMAMGIHRALWIKDKSAIDADVVTKGRIFSAAIKSLNIQLCLCGREWIDTQDDALAAIIAETLGWSHVLNASKIILESTRAIVTREIEGTYTEFEAPLPAVISCQKDLNEPRYPTLIAIKRAKMKEIKQVSLPELAIQIDSSKIKLLSLKAPPARQTGKIVQGEPLDVGLQAVNFLSEQVKVI